jgi:hypothetical protein
MAFQKGNKLGKGRPKGSGRNAQAKEWAEQYGIPFLIRIAEGKETDVNMFGKPVKVSLSKRKEAAEYLIDQGIGRAPQRHEVGGEGGGPIKIMFVPFDARDQG